jgi:hypothetical protein
LRRNFNCFFRAVRVPAYASAPLLDVKNAKISQLYGLALFQGVANTVQDALYDERNISLQHLALTAQILDDVPFG